MKRHIWLRDIADSERGIDRTGAAADIEKHYIEEARKALAKMGLRFDNKTGVTRNNRDGVISSYIVRSEFKPYATEAEVLRWEFRGWILNAASRVKRGLPA